MHQQAYQEPRRMQSHAHTETCSHVHVRTDTYSDMPMKMLCASFGGLILSRHLSRDQNDRHVIERLKHHTSSYKLHKTNTHTHTQQDDTQAQAGLEYICTSSGESEQPQVGPRAKTTTPNTSSWQSRRRGFGSAQGEYLRLLQYREPQTS